MKIFEVNLLRLLSVYEVRYPIVKHILFEVFGVSTIDYEDELRNSMTIGIEGNDYLSYILKHESDFTSFTASENANTSSKYLPNKVIALFLTIVIIQEYNNDLEKIKTYLSVYESLCIPDFMPDDEAEESTEKDNLNADILRNILYNIEYHASTFNENGLNRTVLDLYTRPSYPTNNAIIDTLIVNREYVRKLKVAQQIGLKYRDLDKEAQAEWNYENSGRIYTEVKEKHEAGGVFETSNEELLQDIYFNTYYYSFQEIREVLKSKNIATEDLFDTFYMNEEDLEYRLDKLFDSRKIFAQMKINNHPMAFLLTCDLTQVSATEMIFQEFSDAIIIGRSFRFLIDASSRSIDTVEKFKTMGKGLNLLGIDTTYLDSLVFILENKDHSYYIEYVVLAKFLGLTLESLRKSSKLLLIHEKPIIGKNIFNNFAKHTFNAIYAYENLHLYENLQSSINESLYPLTHIYN